MERYRYDGYGGATVLDAGGRHVCDYRKRRIRAVKLEVRQGFRDCLAERFVIRDDVGGEYSCKANSALEFTISRDGAVMVETKALGRTRGLLLTRPTRFRVFFDGVERGSVHYSLLWPLRRHTLVLDGTTYAIPDGFRSCRSEQLGIWLSWGWFNSDPSVNIAHQEGLHVGLLVKGILFVRSRYC